MNISDFPGFPGFINPISSSHPDKIRVQTGLTVELDIKCEMEKTFRSLKYIETLECRAIMDKEMIDNKRKEYTMIFKTLLQIKERQSIK